MTNIPLFILAFTRLDSLKEAIESATSNFSIGKIYVYLDKFYDKETKEKQIKVLEYLKTLDNVVVNKAKENKGCSAAMKSGLDWVFETENELLVIEEDILLTKESALFLESKIDSVDKSESFVFRFGQYFWGFYLNKKALEEIKGFDLLNIAEETYKEKIHKTGMFRHLNHFRLEQEALRRSMGQPWDREFHFAINILKIPTFVPEKHTTKHNDKGESVRLKRNSQFEKEFDGKLVMINGIIQK
jgi:hypothetical protein